MGIQKDYLPGNFHAGGTALTGQWASGAIKVDALIRLKLGNGFSFVAMGLLETRSVSSFRNLSIDGILATRVAANLVKPLQ